MSSDIINTHICRQHNFYRLYPFIEFLSSFRKNAPGEKPWNKAFPGKLPPVKLPIRKIAPWKIAPGKIPCRKITLRKVVLLAFCCCCHYHTVVHF